MFFPPFCVSCLYFLLQCEEIQILSYLQSSFSRNLNSDQVYTEEIWGSYLQPQKWLITVWATYLPFFTNLVLGPQWKADDTWYFLQMDHTNCTPVNKCHRGISASFCQLTNRNHAQMFQREEGERVREVNSQGMYGASLTLWCMG